MSRDGRAVAGRLLLGSLLVLGAWPAEAAHESFVVYDTWTSGKIRSVSATR